MKTLIRRCASCGLYTLKPICKKCGNETEPAIPPKFSPDDKYALLKARARERRRLASTS